MQLNHSEIHSRLCDESSALIKDYDINNIMPINYDLRLGKQCYIGYSNKKKSGQKNLREGESVKIPSNGILFFETKEQIIMPKDLSARLSLKMSLVANGLFMPVQGPIAPGFKNHLYGMLYNLSDDSITLREGESIVSIEFYKIEPVGEEQLYNGQFNDDNAFNLFTKNKILSSLNSMSIEFNRKFNMLFKFLKVGSYILIALTAILGILTVINYFLNLGK